MNDANVLKLGVLVVQYCERIKEGKIALSCLTPVILWPVACQAPLWDSPVKNTGVGCSRGISELYTF